MRSSRRKISGPAILKAAGHFLVGGVTGVEFDLAPKQENVKNNFSHVTVWVDLARDISLKVVMFQPDGDTRTATYTNIRFNKPVAGSTFTLKVPGGVQVTKR